jgi:O-acetyl-ADP-ribose deacetylase (regulator of RNase III)
MRIGSERESIKSIKGRITEVCLTAVTTRRRKLAVKVTIADITMSQCDGIVCFLGTQLGMMTGTTRDILRSIDENVIQNCLKNIQAGQYQQALRTPATGHKDPIKYIVHAVIATSSAPEKLPELVQDETFRQRIITCLELADRLDIKSIAIPFPELDRVASDRWSLCQNLVQSIVEFDEKSQHLPGNLQTIEFACLALCIADTLTVISRLLFAEQQTPLEVTAELPQAQQAEAVGET